LLGNKCAYESRRGTLITGNYHWIWEKGLIEHFSQHLIGQGKSLTTLLNTYPGGLPGKLFVEESIYHFVSCFSNEVNYTKYIFSDITDFLGDALLSCNASTVLDISEGVNFLEDFGKHLPKFEEICPQIVQSYASFLRQHRIATFSAAEKRDRLNTDASLRFLTSAGTRICTSWCSQEIFDAIINIPNYIRN